MDIHPASNSVYRVNVRNNFGNNPSNAPAAAATSQMTACLFRGGHALTALERSNMNTTNQMTLKDAKNRNILVLTSGAPNTIVTAAAVTVVATNALFGVDSMGFPFSV
jgi:hypothetical protein